MSSPDMYPSEGQEFSVTDAELQSAVFPSEEFCGSGACVGVLEKTDGTTVLVRRVGGVVLGILDGITAEEKSAFFGAVKAGEFDEQETA